MQKITAFNTPIVTPCLRFISRCVLKLAGWKICGDVPDKDRYVIVAAPHTSNWDFPLTLMAAFVYGLNARWLGKASLFPPVIGAVMRWLGGIAIDRASAANRVQVIAEALNEHDRLALIIAPEGTRSKVEQWKSGFYHIAQAADIPIKLSYINAPAKEMGFGPWIEPEGPLVDHMPVIREFYADKAGVRPKLG